MNLKELKERIDYIYNNARSPEDINVGIKIDTVNHAGGTPVCNINSIMKGFDWDDNKVIITAEHGLRKTDANELEKLRKEANELGWSVYEVNNLKRENKRLRGLINDNK